MNNTFDSSFQQEIVKNITNIIDTYEEKIDGFKMEIAKLKEENERLKMRLKQ